MQCAVVLAWFLVANSDCKNELFLPTSPRCPYLVACLVIHYAREAYCVCSGWELNPNVVIMPRLHRYDIFALQIKPTAILEKESIKAAGAASDSCE